MEPPSRKGAGKISPSGLMALLSQDGNLGQSPRAAEHLMRNFSSGDLLEHPSDADGLPFEAVIHFTNSDATLSLTSPWKVMAPAMSTGTGFSIGNKRILTNCHVVCDATSLRVFKHGVPGNYEARVLCESAVCDLALVTVDDEAFWDGLGHVKFQEAVPNLDDTVCAVGYPLGATSVTLTRGVVSNVQMTDLTLTEFQEQQLTLQIDAAINPGNSGGPVFNQETGEVVGVAFSGRRDAEGMGFIIPTPVVRNFIAVYEKTGSFGRLPSLGIEAQPLPNAAMRTLLFGTKSKLTHHNGILITRVERFSCAEAAGVKAGDILMAIDGVSISEEGDVKFRKHERVDYHYLITKKKVGDSVKLTLLRGPHSPTAPSGSFDLNTLVADKAASKTEALQSIDLSVVLTPTHELLPRELKKDYLPEYAIVGGLVFVIAGMPLLEECKRKLQTSPVALPLYETMHMLLEPKKHGNEKAEDLPDRDTQAILCSNCLAHDINEGFAQFVGLRLQKVNGVKIKNMAHLVELMMPLIDTTTSPPSSHAILSFFSMDGFAVFETQRLRSATAVIQKQHKIPSWTSIELKPQEPPKSQGIKRPLE